MSGTRQDMYIHLVTATVLLAVVLFIAIGIVDWWDKHNGR